MTLFFIIFVFYFSFISLPDMALALNSSHEILMRLASEKKQKQLLIYIYIYMYRCIFSLKFCM